MDNKKDKTSPEERIRIRELEQELEIKNKLLDELEKIDNNSTATNHLQKEIEQENLMYKELVENLEGITSTEIEQFFNMISHELKTPLVPIQGYVKLLKEEKLGKLDKIQKEKLGIVDYNTTSLVKLIQDMLDYQKIVTGKLEMNMEKSTLRKIIDEAFLDLKSKLMEKEINLEVLADTDIDFVCDSRRISQVINQILNNSYKAVMPKVGKIWISVSQSPENIHVFISDNGYGIPSDKLEKIFEKFYQLDMSNTREVGGLGLGLALSKKIIEAHNGKIWAESDLKKGTTITFTLPIK